VSPVLDATEIQDENELTPEQEEQEQQEAVDAPPSAIAFDPIRSITLAALPMNCGTTVTLLVQHAGDDRYRSGFRIVRDYETSPHEQADECLPATDPAADKGYAILGEAVTAAAEMAADWLQFNSDDGDIKAQAALTWLDMWIAELGPVAGDESIFGAEVPVCHPATETGTFFTPPGVLNVLGNPPSDAAPAVTDDARRHYDDRKHSLEEQLGKLSIEQVRLKAAVKCNREAMNIVTGELEDHLALGVVRLPLFDRATPVFDTLIEDATGGAAMKVGQLQEALGKSLVPADEEVAPDAPVETAEAWRFATIEEIGIDPKICQLLRDNNKIETLGQIADHCENYELTDLKKIGKTKAAQIEEAMDAYWLAHPLAEVADAEEGTAEEAA